MTGEDILDFIKVGEIKGIKLGMSITEVYEKLGQPKENAGDLKVGYLIYGIFSLGYFDGIIDELAILFHKNKATSFATKENEFGEVAEINGDMKINEFIYLLNSRGFLWDCYNKSNLDYFIVRSEAGVGTLFDLYDGTLHKISYTKNE